MAKTILRSVVGRSEIGGSFGAAILSNGREMTGH